MITLRWRLSCLSNTCICMMCNSKPAIAGPQCLPTVSVFCFLYKLIKTFCKLSGQDWVGAGMVPGLGSGMSLGCNATCHQAQNQTCGWKGREAFPRQAGQYKGPSGSLCLSTSSQDLLSGGVVIVTGIDALVLVARGLFVGVQVTASLQAFL